MWAEPIGLSSCSFCRSSSITVIKVTDRDLMMDRRKSRNRPADVKQLMRRLHMCVSNNCSLLSAWGNGGGLPNGLLLTWHLVFLLTETTLTDNLMLILERRKIALQWLVNLSKPFFMPLHWKLCTRSTNRIFHWFLKAFAQRENAHIVSQMVEKGAHTRNSMSIDNILLLIPTHVQLIFKGAKLPFGLTLLHVPLSTGID